MGCIHPGIGREFPGRPRLRRRGLGPCRSCLSLNGWFSTLREFARTRHLARCWVQRTLRITTARYLLGAAIVPITLLHTMLLVAHETVAGPAAPIPTGSGAQQTYAGWPIILPSPCWRSSTRLFLGAVSLRWIPRALLSKLLRLLLRIILMAPCVCNGVSTDIEPAEAGRQRRGQRHASQPADPVRRQSAGPWSACWHQHCATGRVCMRIACGLQVARANKPGSTWHQGHPAPQVAGRAPSDRGLEANPREHAAGSRSSRPEDRLPGAACERADQRMGSAIKCYQPLRPSQHPIGSRRNRHYLSIGDVRLSAPGRLYRHRLVDISR